MTWTHAILIATAVLLIAWDVIAHFIGQPQESAVLRDLSRSWTVLPFLIGVLVGHWFGPRQHTGPSGWGLTMIPALVVLGGDLLWRYLSGQPEQLPLWRWGIWYSLLGIPCGILLWGQHAHWSPW